MSASAKVAVSIPAATFQALERERKRLHFSRSKLVTQAIDAWLRGRELDEADRRYVEAYLREPERTEEVAAVAAAAVSGWEPWK